MSLKKKLGARIQEIRKSKGLTQDNLAEKIDMDKPNLSNIETGKRFLSADTLEKIVNALEVKPKDLFDFEHKQNHEDLRKSINDIITTLDPKELEYVYKSLVNLKELKK